MSFADMDADGRRAIRKARKCTVESRRESETVAVNPDVSRGQQGAAESSREQSPTSQGARRPPQKPKKHQKIAFPCEIGGAVDTTDC